MTHCIRKVKRLNYYNSSNTEAELGTISAKLKEKRTVCQAKSYVPFYSVMDFCIQLSISFSLSR